MTRHLDPDRRPPGPEHPGYDPAVVHIDVELRACRWCRAAIPDTELDKMQHVDWDQRVASRLVQLIERVAILEAAIAQLSGSGSRTATPAGVTADASLDPDTKSPPTPPEEATAGPGGAEGSNDGTEADAAAGTSLGDVTPPAAAFPPAAAGTNRVGRGSGDPGEHHGSAPAGTFHGDAPNLPLSDESVDLWTP